MRMIVWPSRLSLRMNCPQALPQLDVDAGGRLVEHDHRRLVHERLADQHAPLHAARQRAHVGVGLRREVEVMQDLVDPVVVVAQAEVAGLDAQRLAHREERIEHELLRHDAERAARVAVVGDDVVAQDAHRAAVGARQAGEDRDQRRLAGAVRTEQAEELARARPSRSTPASACTRPKRRATSATSTAAGIGGPGHADAVRLDAATISVVDAVDARERRSSIGGHADERRARVPSAAARGA